MTKVKTVYDHIRANNIKTIALVALFPMIFIALVFLFTWIVVPAHDAFATTVAVAIPTAIACLVWLGISWAFGDSMMLNMAGAHQIYDTDPKNREIFRAVENVALAAGLPTPRVYIIDDDSMNAFATGRSPRDASVALTRGIIKRLDRLELEGVIAHEMAHIGNRDIRLDMLLITGVGVTVFAADIIWRMIISGSHHSSNDNDNKNGAAVLFMVWLAFMVFNFIVTPLLRMAVSRNREYAADATGAHITRNPAALASALRKITTDARVECLDKAKSMSTACIAYPGGPREFASSLLATHPPVEKRIARLESMNLKA
ncbi:MAG: M48 family metallopeptidase [Alphaproteobacteria bacterium]|nr:M48 family metallopeptidase [Alphaproteobacteria bacterium]